MPQKSDKPIISSSHRNAGDSDSHPNPLTPYTAAKQPAHHLTMATSFDSFGHWTFWVIVLLFLSVGAVARYREHRGWIYHNIFGKEHPLVLDENASKLNKDNLAAIRREEKTFFKRSVFWNQIGIGLPLTIFALVLTASYIQAKKIVHFQYAMEIAACVIPAFISFISVSLHDLLKRLTSVSGGG